MCAIIACHGIVKLSSFGYVNASEVGKGYSNSIPSTPKMESSANPRGEKQSKVGRTNVLKP